MKDTYLSHTGYMSPALLILPIVTNSLDLDGRCGRCLRGRKAHMNRSRAPGEVMIRCIPGACTGS
jgi:hypothetical protein